MWVGFDWLCGLWCGATFSELALTGLDGEEPIWVKPLMVLIPAASGREDFFFNDNESRSQKQQSSWVGLGNIWV